MKKIASVLFIILCSVGFTFAKTATTPANSTDVDVVGQKLDGLKEDVGKLKESWDKTRLEVTLYEKRAKRAYQKWVKAAKKVKADAKIQKEKADLELQLAVERRKLAFSQWQSRVFLQTAEESHLKSLAQDKDTKAIQEKIDRLEAKLKPLATPAPSTK
jgi:phytoene dehydrogenase-like protein